MQHQVLYGGELGKQFVGEQVAGRPLWRRQRPLLDNAYIVAGHGSSKNLNLPAPLVQCA